MNIDIYMKNISFAGIANYIKMFQDGRVANATFHTFYFALLEVPLQMIVALLLLMFMLRNTKLHKLLRTVFYLPYVCSMTAVSIMWSMLLNTHYGMLPHLLGKIGITMPNMLSSTTWAMPTVIFVTVWKGFGYTLTILSAAALGVSESLYEAAEIDGAGPIRTLVTVYLPLSLPSLATLALFYAVGRWNGFSDALMYLKSSKAEKYWPIQLLLYNIIKNSTQSSEIATQEGFFSAGVSKTIQMASVMFATVPILLVYPWLQRYFVTGVTIGAVKG